jgi:hypothetical protein
MKIWHGHGSEHSANLVMIGHFKDVAAAAKAKEVIDRLRQQVQADCQAGQMDVGSGSTNRYTDGMMDLLDRVKVYDIGPPELEQFAYEVNVDTKGNQVVITTDESDITAFIKVLIDSGARVEVFSAHDDPDAVDRDKG